MKLTSCLNKLNKLTSEAGGFSATGKYAIKKKNSIILLIDEKNIKKNKKDLSDVLIMINLFNIFSKTSLIIRQNKIYFLHIFIAEVLTGK